MDFVLSVERGLNSSLWQTFTLRRENQTFFLSTQELPKVLFSPNLIMVNKTKCILHKHHDYNHFKHHYTKRTNRRDLSNQLINLSQCINNMLCNYSLLPLPLHWGCVTRLDKFSVMNPLNYINGVGITSWIPTVLSFNAAASLH